MKPYDQPETPLSTPYPYYVEVILSEANLTVRSQAEGMLARHAWGLFDVTRVVPTQPWATLKARLAETVKAARADYETEATKRGFQAYCKGEDIPFIADTPNVAMQGAPA